MKGEDVLVRGSYEFHVRKYHAQPKFANDTKQCSEEYANNNSNLGGKTDERPYLSIASFPSSRSLSYRSMRPDSRLLK